MANTLVFKEITFYAAHSVDVFGKDHKCAKLHGHTYFLRVEASSGVDYPYEFAKLESDCLGVMGCLDHGNLNDFREEFGGEPTSERVATWIFDGLRKVGCPVVRVSLKETNTSGVIVEA
jgi:6-pyruvoyltetrahydropterin/6-carboxytetrahydropterin synthase